jgi:hypothetical protein
MKAGAACRTALCHYWDCIAKAWKQTRMANVSTSVKDLPTVAGGEILPQQTIEGTSSTTDTGAIL